MRCIHCGEEISFRDKNCPACGARTGNEEKVQKRKKKIKLILLLAIAAVVGVVAFIGIYHAIKVATIGKYTALAELALEEEDYEEAVDCYLKILRPYRDVEEAQKALAEVLVIAYEKDDMFKYDRKYKDFTDAYDRYEKYVGEYDYVLYTELEELDARIKEEIEKEKENESEEE
ncbi:MAG: hypothetical protein IJ397_07345 [Lachnospiraceae bacterium]|nr:hypothetical protein [Lachnospiraceae bacterium]